MKTIYLSTSSLIKFFKEFLFLSWLSVSSSRFYSDLYTKFKGYGIKFSLIVISITSIAYVTALHSNIVALKYYLTNSNMDNNPIDHLLKQMPTISYNGREIKTEEVEPIFITNFDGKIIFVIDMIGQLPEYQKKKIPVLLLKDKIVVRFEQSDNPKEKNNFFSSDYSFILGRESAIFDYISLKSRLLKLAETFSLVTFVAIIPLVICARLCLYLVKNLLPMILLYGTLQYTKMKPSIQSVSRMSLFSSATAELICGMLIIVAPKLLFIGKIVEYWAIILSLIGLFKLKKQRATGIV